MQNTENFAGIKKRIYRISLYGVGTILVGIMYGMFVKTTGIAIPCIFYRLTGWKCPGCGVTRMCVALLQWKWREAFGCHPMLLVQLPFLGLIVLRNVIDYIKYGVSRVSRLETIVIYICIGLLVVFTVLRNVLGL